MTNKQTLATFTPRRILAALAIAGMTLASAGTAQAEVTLFADNFDRPDAVVVGVGASSDGDINGTNAGKSGTLGNLQWTARAYSGNSFGVVDNTLTQVDGPNSICLGPRLVATGWCDFTPLSLPGRFRLRTALG